MDEELKQRVLSYMDATEKMVSGEMPLVAQEYLSFYFYSSLAGCLLFVVLGLSCAALLAKLLFSTGGDKEAKFFFGLMSVGGIILSLIFLGVNSYEVAKVSIAPRVVLLEAAAILIGGDR